MTNAISLTDEPSVRRRTSGLLSFEASETFGEFAHSGCKSLYLLDKLSDLVAILRDGFGGCLLANERAAPWG